MRKGGEKVLQSVRVGKIYRNKKNQQSYVVHKIVHHSETMEKMVQYEALYVTDKPDWVRPIELFKEKFEEVIKDGTTNK